MAIGASVATGVCQYMVTRLWTAGCSWPIPCL